MKEERGKRNRRQGLGKRDRERGQEERERKYEQRSLGLYTRQV